MTLIMQILEIKFQLKIDLLTKIKSEQVKNTKLKKKILHSLLYAVTVCKQGIKNHLN